MVDNINKKPITIYWSSTNCIEKNKQDWSFLYPNPKTLFLDLKQNKEKNIENSSFFSCPAINDKTKKILVFYSPMSCEYEYDFNNDKNFFSAKSENYLAIEAIRKPALKFSPTIQFSLGYCFFSEESLDAYFTPPMFHKPEYLKYGSCFPGEFDIGQWFRPYNFEVQPWEKNGNFILKENEPLFYVELKTKRDIIMKKFNSINYTFLFITLEKFVQIEKIYILKMEMKIYLFILLNNNLIKSYLIKLNKLNKINLIN